MDLPLRVFDSMREQLATAKQRKESLQREFDEATKIEDLWQNLWNYLEKDWPLHLLDLIARNHQRIARSLADSTVVECVDTIRRQAQQQADAVMRRYPTHFEQAFQGVGLTLDADSRHPRYSLEQKFFQIEIDEQRRHAKLRNHEGELADLPADVNAVAEAVKRERHRLFSRAFDGSVVLSQLRSQYLAVLKGNKQPDGTAVPIRQITRRLGKNLKGFRSDEFLIDLSRLVEQGPFEIQGLQLDLQQTKDTNQGMLLHGAAGRGYVGFIVFRRVPE